MAARPLSAKSVAVYWCLDSQIFMGVAIQALGVGRKAKAIRAMQYALTCSRLATGKFEGLPRGKP